MSDTNLHDLRSDESLIAFLDGELDAGTADAVAALLRTDAAVAKRMAFLAKGKLAFRDAFDLFLAEAPTERMEAALPDPPRATGLPRRRLLASLAACLVAGIAADRAIDLGWRWARQADDDNWRAVVANYMRLYSFDTLNNLVIDDRLEATQVERVADALNLPLTRQSVDIPGAALKRAQMLSYKGGALAQIAYLDPTYGPLAFCVMRASKGAAPPQVERRYGMNVVYWSTKSHSFMLIGRSPIDNLRAAAATLSSTVDAA